MIAGASGARVLVVDDERPVATVVARWLQRAGMRADVAHSADEALARVGGTPYDLVLSDIHMPGISGLQLAREVKVLDATIQVVIMTGNTRLQPAIDALRLDADDYLLKPFEPAALVHSASRAIEHRRLLLENRSYREKLEERIQAQARRLEGLYVSGIHALVRALETKDPHTRGHSGRVADHAAALARTIPGVDVDVVRVGAQLHDIGKIGIREAILGKEGPLTVAEAEEVRAHPRIGEEILSPMLEDRRVLRIVRHHHERWDGAGYPDGLVGEDIPVEARIVAIADAYDAMITDRPYRPALSVQCAVVEIRAEAGRQFDPDLARDAAVAFETLDLAS